MRKPKPFGIPSSQFAYTKAAQKMKGLSPREKAVLVAITSFVCKYGGAFPSHGTIAKETGYSSRTVRRAIIDLERRGLIRRVPTSRAFHGNSSNFYAAVLSVGQPSGQHVQAIGQHMRNSQDTVAALIRPVNQTKEEDGRLILLEFEEYLLEALDEVIDFKRHPSLVCLGSVSHWLFNGHARDQFEPALVHLMEEADRLSSDYRAESKMLSNWSELVGRLKNGDALGVSNVPSNELHPICEEIWELLSAPERIHVRSREYLRSLRIERDGDRVIISSDSKSALRYIQGTCQAALAHLADRHGYDFDVR